MTPFLVSLTFFLYIWRIKYQNCKKKNARKTASKFQTSLNTALGLESVFLRDLPYFFCTEIRDRVRIGVKGVGVGQDTASIFVEIEKK